MESIVNSQECQAQLFEFLVRPALPDPKKKRARAAPSKIKTLYHLYQLDKNRRSGKWEENFQGRKRIAKGARVTERHLKEFINSPDCSLFCSIRRRGGTTSIYKLEPWVIDFFDFFERKGMMKSFRTDFDRWRELFLKRLCKWLIPLLRKKHTLDEILMNKLSTKKSLKGPGSESLKGPGIKPSGASPMKPFGGSRSNPEPAPLQAIKSLEKTGAELKTRFHIQDGDLNWLINSFSLNDLKGAYRIRASYGDSYKPESPIKMFMHCMKKHRSLKSGRRSF